jgi:8-oxo-dGTP diphosphatase
MATIKQFGMPDPALTYKPRTGGYGILARDGLIACVRIGYDNYSYDLPGGAADGDETPALKCEADHELVWLNPLQVITNLKNEGYAWPLILWLRNQ